jgi:histidinol dehydrogenase
VNVARALAVMHDGSAAAEEFFARIKARASGVPRAIDDAVRVIVEDVRIRGDAALADWSERLDGARLEAHALEVPREAWHLALQSLAQEDRDALELAAARIDAYHRRERQDSWEWMDGGARLGLLVRPLARVGIYVPGGRAAYPSSVLMNAIPARVAGVREIVAVTPARSGDVPASILAACEIAGVSRLFRVGGAQAVAALAFGTATVPKVDKIVGPGNLYVAGAKRIVQAAMACDIDRFAGPSEVVIVADGHADAELVALDLLAQAEHDEAASSVLLTWDAALAERVSAAVEHELSTLARAAIARPALEEYGAAIVVADLDRACVIADAIAPEHLGVHTALPRAVLARVRAGAVFLGTYAPEAIGDYVAGPNHVLPTAGAARFGSPLGVYDFVSRSSVVELGPDDLARIGPAAVRLATLEGLDAHARSVERRLARLSKQSP